MASKSKLFPGAAPLTQARVDRLKALIGPMGVRSSITGRELLPDEREEPSAWDRLDMARGELVLMPEWRGPALDRGNTHPVSIILFTSDGLEIQMEQVGPPGSGQVVVSAVRPAREG